MVVGAEAGGGGGARQADVCRGIATQAPAALHAAPPAAPVRHNSQHYNWSGFTKPRARESKKTNLKFCSVILKQFYCKRISDSLLHQIRINFSVEFIACRLGV